MGVVRVNDLVAVVINEEADISNIFRGKSYNIEQIKLKTSDAHILAPHDRKAEGVEGSVGDVDSGRVEDERVNHIFHLRHGVFDAGYRPINGDGLSVARIGDLVARAAGKELESGQGRARGGEVAEGEVRDGEGVQVGETGADGDNEDGAVTFIGDRVGHLSRRERAATEGRGGVGGVPEHEGRGGSNGDTQTVHGGDGRCVDDGEWRDEGGDVADGEGLIEESREAHVDTINCKCCNSSGGKIVVCIILFCSSNYTYST